MIKFIKRTLFLAPLFAGLIWMQGCIHDDFDEPDMEEVPVGTVMSIAELRAMETPHTFEGDYSVYGTVTMDDKSGNIYRSAFVQDEEAAINLRLQAPGGIYEGDSVRIYLRHTELSTYQGMLQLDNVNVDQHIIKQETGVEVEPTPVSIADINSSMQAHLVEMQDVQFIDEHVGLPFADEDELQALNRTLEDCHGDTIIVRTSGYANFASELTPEGNGTLIAVVTEHRGTMQLYIRHFHEVNLDGERCDPDDDDNGEDPDAATSIDEDFQGYENYDEITANGWSAIAEVGERSWICRTFEDDHFAQATAFNSDDDHNIMWMITPAVDLDASAQPVLEFLSAQAHYTHDGFSVHIASDFNGQDVQDANWEELPATLAGSGDGQYDWVDSGLIDLADYTGVVHIAWRYEGSDPDGNTGTFRVNNVKLYDNE